MSERLRIAFFVGAFPVASETFILRQITGLIDLGHDVRIFANARAEETVFHQSVADYQLLEKTTFIGGPPESVLWEMPVRPVNGETWLPGAEHPISNASRLAQVFPLLAQCAATAPQLTRNVLAARDYGYRARSLSGAYRLATLLRCGQRFDVLHAHFGPVANSFRFARQLFQAPLVVSFHGYDFCTVPRKEGGEVYEHLWKTADAFMANSAYTRGRLLALGCPESKLSVLPVGLNPADYRARDRTVVAGKPFKLLTVARLVGIKGHEFALRAVALLRKQSVNVHYDIVGDGPLQKPLLALAAELGISGAVTFHGARREHEVREYFDDAHLFLLTSVNLNGDEEGQGLALQEAQASGLPVISTRHGAFPEGIAKENEPWTVPERDVPALAQTLLRLIEAREQWPVIGRAGRLFVEQRYDIRVLNRQLVELYRRAVATFAQ